MCDNEVTKVAKEEEISDFLFHVLATIVLKLVIDHFLCLIYPDGWNVFSLT